MDNPNNYNSLNTPLDSGQTNVEKPNKSIWFIIFFVFLIFVIISLTLFFYWDGLFKNKEIPSPKTTVKCEEVEFNFNLTSCNYFLNYSNNFYPYQTSVEFKETSQKQMSELFVFFNLEDGNIKFEKITDTQDISEGKEFIIYLKNAPNNFYLLSGLLGSKDNCKTPEFLCSTKNNAPIANAGNNLTVNESSLVILNGSESYDPDGDLLTYTWIQVSGINIILNNNNSVITNFTAPEVSSQQVLKFKLVVSDGNFSGSDIVEIRVNDLDSTGIVYDISAPPPLPN